MKVTINGRTIYKGKIWKTNEVALNSDEGSVNINFIIDATSHILFILTEAVSLIIFVLQEKKILKDK